MNGDKRNEKTLWQKINFLNLGIMHFIGFGGLFFVAIILDMCFSGYFTINLIITIISYLGFPTFVIYKAQKNNIRYPIKQIKKIAIINGVVMWLFWILIGSTGNTVWLWGWVAYGMMKDRIALKEETVLNSGKVATRIVADNSTAVMSVQPVYNTPDMSKPAKTDKRSVKVTVKRKTNVVKATAESSEHPHYSFDDKQINEQIKFCRKCGSKLAEGALYCIKCGTKI